MVISVLKMVILSGCGILYVLTAHLTNNGKIFDLQDCLLRHMR